MTDDKLDMIAIAQQVAEAPRRDNSTYLRAIAEARQAFQDAESALGGPVSVRIKTKLKRSGAYVVKWTFERLT